MDAEINSVNDQVVKRGTHGEVLAQKNKADAKAFAVSVRPAMLIAMKKGSRRPTAVARKLNESGVPCSNGGIWYPQTVKRVLERLGPEFMEEAQALRNANISDAEKQFMAQAIADFGVKRG
jgi:hypothetical protein